MRYFHRRKQQPFVDKLLNIASKYTRNFQQVFTYGKFMIMFTYCFMMGKAHGWGRAQNAMLDEANALSQAPYFWSCLTLELYITHNLVQPIHNDYTQLIVYERHLHHYRFKFTILLLEGGGPQVWGSLEPHYPWSTHGNQHSPMHQLGMRSFWLFLDELQPPTQLVPKPSPSLYLFMATTITTSFFLPSFLSHRYHSHGDSSLRRRSPVEICGKEERNTLQLQVNKRLSQVFSFLPSLLSSSSLLPFLATHAFYDPFS